MIYFSDASGTLTRCVPEQIYQGAAEGNRLFLVAPFAQNAEVSAAFRLPDGTSTERFRLAYAGAVEGVGSGVYSWQCALPACVTAEYGTVTVQFFRTVSGEEQAGFAAQFTVERGVQPQLPASPAANVYQAIIEALAAIGADLHNGFYAARSIYAWNASYTYGANEITFYPAGEHGALVRSKKADNETPPYDAGGALNGQDWEELVNFDTLSEEFFTALQAEADRAEGAADRAQAFAQQLAAVLDEDVELVEELPSSPQEGTLYLLAGGENSLFELWAYDGEWHSFGGADIVLNTTRFYTGTLTAAGWSNKQQALSFEGMGAEDAVCAVPADGYAAAYLAAGIRAEAVQAGGVLFSCKSVPSAAVKVCVTSTKREEAPIAAPSEYYTKSAADALFAAETSARTQADSALSGRIDGIVAGTTAVGSATYATSAGSAASATKASQDGSGNDIASTYATKAELEAVGFDAEGNYPDLTAGEATYAASAGSASSASFATSAGSASTASYAVAAGSAASATSATNATNDGAGNNIAATYATKAELAAAGGSGGSSTGGSSTGGSSSGGALYAHHIFYRQDAGANFTAAFVSASAVPLSTPQLLLQYLKDSGFICNGSNVALLSVSGDSNNGDYKVYGIGEHPSYPTGLGCWVRDDLNEVRATAFALDGATCSDKVIAL